MKKIEYFVFTIALLLFGIMGVNAEEKGVKIIGRNTFGRLLEVQKTCDDCTIKTIEWYYNSENSVTGGTLIAAARGINIPQDLLGKYIYVNVTFNDDDTVYTDITDATTNTTAIVSDYILWVTDFDYSITATDLQNLDHELEVILTGTNVEGELGVLFVKDADTEPAIMQNNFGCYMTPRESNTYGESHRGDESVAFIDIYNDWYLFKEYDYAYVIHYEEEDEATFCYVNKTPIRVNRPALPAINDRYDVVLRPTQISVTSRFPGNSLDDVIVTKIGIVDDNSVLKSLAKKETNAYEKLLAYAKTATGKTFEVTREKDIEAYKVEDGKYYYIYSYYKDVDNLYRNTEGISIAQGRDGELWDVDYSKIVYKEDKTEEVKKEETKTEEKVYEFTIIYENGGGKDGVEKMANQVGKSNEEITLATNEYKWEKPKKRLFLGWKVYIEDADGNREEVKDSNGKVLTCDEGSTLKDLKVPEGSKLVLVASWSPATGIVVPIIEFLALIGGAYFIINYSKKKRAFNKI